MKEIAQEAVILPLKQYVCGTQKLRECHNAIMLQQLANVPIMAPLAHKNSTAIGGTAPMNTMLNCERTFVIENGRIQSWSWKGNNCY